MSPTLVVMCGVIAGTVSLITVAVSACLVAAGRADKQASRMRIPLSPRLPRETCPPRVESSLKN